jgi:signal peptidase I
LEGEPRADRWRSASRALFELPVMLPISFVLVFGSVRPVIASPFYGGSESMVPTL